MRRLVLSAWLLALAAGCGPTPEEACEDARDTLITRFEECEPGSGSVVNQVWPDCDTVVEIRDEVELYDECLPALESLPCTKLLQAGPVYAFGLPASCNDQLRFEP